MTRRRGMPSTSGVGIILCNACGEPLRDHPMGRCSKLILPPDARLTVGRPVSKGKNPDSYSAQRKRRQRAR